jgi:hypothetical protein
MATTYNPRTPVSSSYNTRSTVASDYSVRDVVSSSYGSRTDAIFLMTQALDFLMTQDNNYIVLQNSYSDYNVYDTRPVVSSSYNLRPII